MSPRSKLFVPAAISAVLSLATLQAIRADSPTTGGTVNVSGSTAFQGFFTSPGSTNDFIDVNSDGTFGFNNSSPFAQQLAPNISINPDGTLGVYSTGLISGVDNAAALSVQYRGVGSVNGLVELVKYALAGAVPANNDAANPGFLNRTQISVRTPAYTGPGAFPVNTPLTSIDAAVLDVSIPWAIQGAATATPKWNLKPTAPGYGLNSSLPSGALTQDNKLASLTIGNQSLNLNGNNSHSVFGTSIAFAPVSIVSNHGTGIQNITQSELAFLYVTGRASDGTNLVAATRDIGSGTRNGAMNSIGVDPSFATGENLGDFTVPGSQQQNIGPHFQPTNLDATGTMTGVVRNNRLAVGYVSTTTGKSSQATGAYETLGVKFNGSSDFVRPTADSIVNNDGSGVNGTGYRIGGAETFATVGDPLANDWAGRTEGTYTLTTNASMSNSAAALYIRNIYESVASFTANPAANSNTFMPAQSLISSNFIPLGSLKLIQDPLDPEHWIPNPALTTAANTAGAAISGLDTGAYGSGAAPFGVVPTRENLGATGTYSDGQVAAYRFYDNTADTNNAATGLHTISANIALNLRNAIAGDFDGNQARNINDVAEMMSAVANTAKWSQLHNSGQVAPAGTATSLDLGTAAIPEILGDFNGDGNFDSKDVRYFADGLAIATSGPHTGKLDRKAGFTAVDTQWSLVNGDTNNHNYFGTTLATPKPYAAGDSRGDIAGAISSPTIGATPTGGDGVVNAKDINYVWTQVRGAMGAGTDGAWSTLLTRAASDPTVNVRSDLSADINGDLVLDASDVKDLVQNVLGTNLGDANLDGLTDLFDLTTVTSNWQKVPGVASWSTGDLNGDGLVDLFDLTAVTGHWQQTTGHDLIAGRTSAVPEPASLAILGVAATGLLIKRRRRGAMTSITR